MTEPLLELEIVGPPVGAQRPRTDRVRARIYMSDAHRAGEARVARVAAAWWGPRAPLDAPVVVEVVAWHRRPQRLRRRSDPRERLPAVRKPDLDNVAKLVLDALVRARVLRDDTVVAELRARRWFLPIADDGSDMGLERVEVRVWPWGAR